ncbi:membrane protein [Actinomadura rubrobrunea]|uniref:Membrane protein n=2 Tax=Actinomadura rubrobrunea TaxID=115335 RepID=A0A9W6PYS3_9ACTN|nr:membrane protein [Actinomadura rubrobrunea]
MTGMAAGLDRLGRWCVRHRRAVIVLWIAAMLSTAALGFARGGTFVQQSSLPGTETQRAIDSLREDFPALTGPTATVVFRGTRHGSPADWRVALAIGEAIDRISRLDRVAYAENPYVAGMGGLRSDDAVVVRVSFKGTMGDLSPADLDILDRAVEPARKAGVEVDFGGIAAMLLNQPKGGPQEAAGIVMALVVLLLAFGSFLAAGIPIVVSLCGMAVAYSLIHFAASQVEVHPTAPMAAAMLGIGAGIDYALFIVTRYRQQLAAGDDVETAVGKAMAHSGHAVVFAGGTVVFAICGLFLAGIAFVGRIGLASALAVGVMVLAALTLLPAVLGVLGTRIDRWRLPRVRPDRSADRWMRWGRHVDRHAWPYAIGAALVLLAMSIPTLSLRFGVMADSTAAPGSDARQAYDVVAREFGPGHYSPFVIVAKVPGRPGKADRRRESSPPRPSDRPGAADRQGTADRHGGGRASAPKPEGLAGLGGLTGPPSPKPSWTDKPPPASANVLDAAGEPDPDALRVGQRLRQRVAEVPRVAFAAEPVVAGRTAIVRVIPATAPHETATTDLVHRLRAATARTPGAVVHVGGENPAIIDIADTVGARMPAVVVAVVGASLALLMIAFRAVVVPVKAALMNLLSIGASFGVVTAVFQWGWGVGLLGLDQPIPVMSFVPLFMFALVFGLSMDYEVFLLARIREEYLRSGDPHDSVARGIGATARLITSAALIMIFVFAGFVPQPDPTIKMMALGMAVAVAVDATLVRMVLVPALMSLLGHANWWWPGRGRGAGRGAPGERLPTVIARRAAGQEARDSSTAGAV